MNKSADEIIQMIAEVLAEASGEFIAQIANDVGIRCKPVESTGDSMFLIEEDDDDK